MITRKEAHNQSYITTTRHTQKQAPFNFQRLRKVFPGLYIYINNSPNVTKPSNLRSSHIDLLSQKTARHRLHAEVETRLHIVPYHPCDITYPFRTTQNPFRSLFPPDKPRTFFFPVAMAPRTPLGKTTSHDGKPPFQRVELGGDVKRFNKGETQQNPPKKKKKKKQPLSKSGMEQTGPMLETGE